MYAALLSPARQPISAHGTLQPLKCQLSAWPQSKQLLSDGQLHEIVHALELCLGLLTLPRIDGRLVNMAFLATVGGSAVNGVAAIHSEIIKEDIFQVFPPDPPHLSMLQPQS